MTAINPETQIIGTAFDPKARVYSYTYQHTDGSRYTVKIPAEQLDGLKTKVARRNFIALKIRDYIQSNRPDNA